MRAPEEITDTWYDKQIIIEVKSYSILELYEYL